MKKLFLTLVILIFNQLAFSEEATLEADEIIYDKSDDKIIATGNVEVFKDGYYLSTEKLEYNKKLELVNAFGKVRIIEPNGEEINAETAEIDKKLKKAIIGNLTARLKQKISFAANLAIYEQSSKILILHKSVFTTCPVCKGSWPIWQMKSEETTYYRDAERVKHKHGVLQIYGKSVLYFPYLVHGTPKTKPRSGILFPKYSYSTYRGQGIEIPFYYRSNDDFDLTYSPILTQKKGILHKLQTRKLTPTSSLEFDGSFNNYSKSKYENNGQKRFHINTKIESKISENFDLRAKLEKVSDKSYLHNFFDKHENYLTTDVGVWYEKRRDNADIRFINFQDLRDNKSSGTSPTILPNAALHKEFALNNSSKLVYDGNALLLSRSEGMGYQRLINQLSFIKNYNFAGSEFKANFSARQDLYKNSFANDKPTANQKKEISRFLPSVAFEWKYPLVKISQEGIFTIQPLTQLILMGKKDKNEFVINEDSLSPEISDVNIFRANRYTGLDLIESGSKLNYGFFGSFMGADGKKYNLLLGQSYKSVEQKNHSENSGFYKKFSDIVGRVDTQITDNIELFYRFRIDSNNYHMRRSEISGLYKYKNFNLGLSFAKYNPKIYQDNMVIRSVNVSPSIYFTKNWELKSHIKASANKEKSYLISSGAGLNYMGDCLGFSLNASKDFTTDPKRSLKSNRIYSLDLFLIGI